MEPTTKPADSERGNLLTSLGFGEIDEFEDNIDDEWLLEEEDSNTEEDESTKEPCSGNEGSVEERGCTEFPAVEESSEGKTNALFSDSPNVDLKEPEAEPEAVLEEEENLTVASLFSNRNSITQEEPETKEPETVTTDEIPSSENPFDREAQTEEIKSDDSTEVVDKDSTSDQPTPKSENIFGLDTKSESESDEVSDNPFNFEPNTDNFVDNIPSADLETDSVEQLSDEETPSSESLFDIAPKPEENSTDEKLASNSLFDIAPSPVEKLTSNSLFDTEPDNEDTGSEDKPSAESLFDLPSQPEDKLSTEAPNSESLFEDATDTEDILNNDSNLFESNLASNADQEQKTDFIQKGEPNLFDADNIFETNESEPQSPEAEVSNDLDSIKAIEESKEKAEASFVEIGPKNTQANFFSHSPDLNAEPITESKETVEPTIEEEVSINQTNNEQNVVESIVEEDNSSAQVGVTLFGDIEPEAEPVQPEVDSQEELNIESASEEIGEATTAVAEVQAEETTGTSDDIVDEDDNIESNIEDELDLNCPGCSEILTLSTKFLGIEGECVFCEIPILAHKHKDGKIAIIRPSDLEKIKADDEKEELETNDSDESAQDEATIEAKEIITPLAVEVLDEPKKPSGNQSTEKALIECESELVESLPSAETMFDLPKKKPTPEDDKAAPLFFDSIDKVANTEKEESRTSEQTNASSLFQNDITKNTEQSASQEQFGDFAFPKSEGKTNNSFSEKQPSKERAKKKTNDKLITAALIVFGSIAGATAAAKLVPLNDNAPQPEVINNFEKKK